MSSSQLPDSQLEPVLAGRSVSDAEPAVRVLVVDAHSFFRKGVSLVLTDEGMNVVGEAADGEEGVRLVTRLSPDVVVIDTHMPGLSGIEATRRVVEQSPGTQVLVFTTSGDDDDVLRAIAAGARGYLLKGAPMDELVEGVRTLAAGGSTVSPRAAAPLLRQLRAHATEAAMDTGLPDELSEREVEVLKLLTQGADNSVIGASLHISKGTVKNHISAILEKLRVENRVQAAVVAVRAGLA